MRLILLFLWLCLTSCLGQTSQPYDLLIANVNLIDGTGAPLQEGVDIYIKDQHIALIEKEGSRQAKMTIDGTGKYLIPGLFDCHIHTADYITDFPIYAHYGVTSVFITGGSTCTNTYFAEMSSMGQQDSLPAPRVFHTSQHFTMEGRHPVKTYANSNWEDGKTVFFLKDTAQIANLVKEVAQYPIQGIKLTIEDGPFPPFVERMPQEFVDKVAKEAKGNGLEVFVHASDNIELAMAQKAGIRNYLHYVMIDLDWEQDASVISGLKSLDASIVTTLMLKKSWLYPLHPEWIQNLKDTHLFSDEDMEYLSSPARKGKSFGILKGRKFMTGEDVPLLSDMISPQMVDLKALQKEGINLVLGTDTGNEFILPGISLHEEMQIIELGGMDRLQIIKMATHNAAKMLKQLDHLGTIEEGKLADMILLDKNPLEAISNTLAINTVIKNGCVQKRMD